MVPTLPTRLRTEPAAVAEELRAAYRAAAARPRPAVHAIPRPSGTARIAALSHSLEP
jgi:hypothetical protein